MKNVHLLSTDKPSRLFIDVDDNKLKICVPLGGEHMMNQHIYITSDEEIKVGDWFIFDTDIKTIVLNAKGINLDTISVDKNIHVGYWVISKYCKKIILTTDQDLIDDGVQPIDDEFLEWFAQNPSCEEVEVNDWLDTNGNIAWGGDKRYQICNHLYDKIIIPQEELKQEYVKCTCANSLEYSNCGKKCERILDEQEPKQETIEKAAEKFTQIWFNNNDFTKELFIAGAKWQSERMYSEEDVKSFGQFCADYNYRCFGKKTQEEMLQIWSEQFKKK